MHYKKGAMVYGESNDIEFIGIITEHVDGDKVIIDPAIIREEEWVNLSSPMIELESSIIEIVGVDLFDLFHDVKKQPSFTLDEYLNNIAGAGSVS